MRAIGSGATEPATAPTILICEDDPLLRRLIVATLASESYSVVEAASAEEALARLQERKPAVAILDIHLGGATGLAVLERIRAEPALAGVRVLLLSGSVDVLDDEWARGAGADGQLAKPFAVEALREKVRALVSPAEGATNG